MQEKSDAFILMKILLSMVKLPGQDPKRGEEIINKLTGVSLPRGFDSTSDHNINDYEWEVCLCNVSALLARDQILSTGLS
jgi:hypothetical protein